MMKPREQTIVDVREAWDQSGYVSFSPFFRGLPAAQLAEELKIFANDTNEARSKLVAITGVTPDNHDFDFTGGNIRELSEQFAKILVEPYQGLRTLEKELSDQDVLKSTLNGLQNVELFAKRASNYLQRHEMHG